MNREEILHTVDDNQMTTWATEDVYEFAYDESYLDGRTDAIKEIVKKLEELNEESCGDIDYIISKIKEEY